MSQSSHVFSFAEFSRAKYFTALDGLRAASILLVLLHHVPFFEPGILAQLQANGRFGVSFFFVISGFLICTLLLRERRDTGTIALGKFYGRRALRLLPLYYTVLAIEAVLVLGFHQYSPANEVLFREKLPAYLLYYSNWLATATHGPFFVSWSLAVEEQFYLVFGMLVVFVPRRFLIPTLTAALGLKFFLYQRFGNIDAGSTTWRVLFSYQEAILWGVLLAFALNNRRVFDVVARLLRPRATPLILSAAIMLWLTFHAMDGQSTWDAEILFVLMTLTVAALVIRRRVPVLCARPMVHIGRISYGIYLLHMLVMSAVKKIPGFSSPGMCFALTLLLVVALASVVYRYFEAPIIAYYKRRFSPARRDSSAPVGVMGETSPTTS
jgi:peptidoglycan/LPS O-acetylase OafA/YrhL